MPAACFLVRTCALSELMDKGAPPHFLHHVPIVQFMADTSQTISINIEI